LYILLLAWVTRGFTNQRLTLTPGLTSRAF